jgi:eukaryotic-like serine/threonine-protein kinase
LTEAGIDRSSLHHCRMDPTVAKRMTEELTGKTVGGWTIGSYLGAGKSALVFECAKEQVIAALKVFDPDLVNRYGKSVQLARINRELSLTGKHHPNLVQIYGGGECKETGYLFVAMELIRGQNLEEQLASIPRQKISKILSQVTSAAMFLERLGLAHRDIKPSNIAITTDFDRAVLMDLGVLRPFGESNLTDQEAKVFVGTLRYSSPEFLYRDDVGSEECWKAVSIYQLGGVLHDLIMRKQLFAEFSEPFSLLVDAVNRQIPNIFATDVSPDLVVLARNSLAKDPVARLRLVDWDDFLVSEPAIQDDSDAIRIRIAKRRLAAKLQTESSASTVQFVAMDRIRQLIRTIENIVHDHCVSDDSFPRMSISNHEGIPATITVEFAPSEQHCLDHKLEVCFQCEIVEELSFSVCIDSSACLLPSGSESLEERNSIDLFRGPLSSSNLPQKIIEYLYRVLDWAQGTHCMPITEALSFETQQASRES